MAKTSKKAMGIGLAGVMSVGSIAGAVSALNANQANAAESKAQQDAKGIITHTIMSINKWYAGIKNQATWEGYIREAEGYVKQMPAAESAEAAELTTKIKGLKDTVNAIACINQVEKSMTPKEEGGFGNFIGIKNVAQWKDYLNKAEEAMKGIDKSVFQAKYDELLERFNKVSADVQKVEDKHYEDLKNVEGLYESARKNASLEEAEKALAEAKKLGTHETSKEIVKKIEDLITELKKSAAVTGATIIDSKNIKLEGTGLHNIKAEDITVEGCTVESVKVSEDLQSLNVVLKDDIAPNIERSVKVKASGTEVEFKVTLGVEVKTVEVKSADYSHNKANQKLTLIVNGKEMTVDYLKAAGYKVNFVATTTRGAAAEIFDDGGAGLNVNTSDSGVIAKKFDTHPNLVGTKHKVEVQLTKDTNVIVSNKADIGIYNLDAVAEITSVALVNINPSWMDKDPANGEVGYVLYDDNVKTNKDDYFEDPGVPGINTAYKLNGNTLVSGEIASIAGVYTKDGTKERSMDQATVTVESSNPSVVSVQQNGAGHAKWELKAGNQGTATITVKVGDVSKTIDITVKNEKRYLNKMELEKNSIDIVSNKDITKVKVKTTDQYGEPIGVVDVLEHKPGGDDYVTTGLYPTSSGGNSFAVKGGVVTTTINEDKPMFNEIVIDTRQPAATGAGDRRMGEGYIELDNVTNPPANFVASQFEKTSTTYTIKNIFVNPNTGRQVGGTLGQLSVRNIGATGIGSYKLKYEDNKTNVIDLSDGQVDAALQSYTTTGHLIDDKVDLSTCTIESVTEDVATVVKNGTNDGIEITPKNPGETTIIIKKANGEILIKEKITVKDKTKENLIKSVTFTSLDQITYSDTIYTIYDFMNVEKRTANIGGVVEDDVVNGITLTNPVNSKIRISKVMRTVGTETVDANDLYIDYDGNGVFSTGDKIIGKVTVETFGMSGSPLTMGTNYFGDETANGVLKTPTTPVSGNVSIKVIETTSGNENVVGTKVFKVDVK